MVKITFDTDRCKGCGLCVSACPKKLITISGAALNKKGLMDGKNIVKEIIIPGKMVNFVVK